MTVDSSRDTHSTGSLRPVLADLLDALAGADRPALVCLHHRFDRWPVPSKYPRGITWPESSRALAAIRRVKADVVVTSGHSHRNRARRVGPLVVTEVASTKDYPGVWAGYAVYEGGIVQVVRRVTAPDAMGWIEYSRQAVGGAWRWYAPGRLGDRCFSHLWPTPTGRACSRATPPGPPPAQPGRARSSGSTPATESGHTARPPTSPPARRRDPGDLGDLAVVEAERPVVADHVDAGQLGDGPVLVGEARRARSSRPPRRRASSASSRGPPRPTAPPRRTRRRRPGPSSPATRPSSRPGGARAPPPAGRRRR